MWKIGVTDILLPIFVILKLAGVIDWSWWIVVSPLLLSMYAAFLQDTKAKHNKKVEEELDEQIGG